MNSIQQIGYFILITLEVIIGIYLLLPGIALFTYFILKISGIRIPADKKPFITDKDHEFGIIITAHQEIRFIKPLVDSILKQSYGKFFAYIVADDCDVTTLLFDDSRIIVLKPDQPLNAKVKSIQYGIDNFVHQHDAIIIFDADNLVHPDFLKTMDHYFKKGYKVVQSDFRPKNSDSVYARMDAIGDLFNFFLERDIRMRTGISATIWGSGVCFDYGLYRGIQYKDLLGGFDKKLQSHLVQAVDRIAFASGAILYDEKIASGKSLETQRTRWIHAYFKYFGDSWKIFVSGLTKLNFNLAYFGFNLLRPPLFLVLGSAFLFLVINYIVGITLFFAWLAVLVIFVLSFIGIVVVKGKDSRYLKTLMFMPAFMFRQFMALTKLSKAKKSFMKTQHTNVVYIEDVM